LYLKEKLEGIDFADVNQGCSAPSFRRIELGTVGRTAGSGRAVKKKEHTSVGLVEDNTGSDDHAKVCVSEWVDTPRGKPMVCSFLKPGAGGKEEMCFTFEVTKCDKLFDVLL
jgi:hypothetical protein